ncbi:MAG: class I SAM-dependent methyltransferase [Gemmatimonadota bacterium]|nr:class I SAM-dependent methyltransferase [Gemmatimonadota bacterium]
MERSADPWTRFWASKGELDEVYPSSPRVLETLVAWLGAPEKRVLEIGAGTGRDTAALAARGHRAVALDSSPAALELVSAAAPALTGRGIVGGDGFHLPFADGVFDAVFHQGVLEHFGNPLPFLVENRRVTAPGGLLLADVPQTYHPWTLLKRAALRADRWFAGWETEFTIAELERTVREAGWEIVDTYGDWMVPSLGYRLIRELAGAAGASLPRRPPSIAPVRRLRRAVRERLLAPRASRWVAHTIGVVARNPEPYGGEG